MWQLYCILIFLSFNVVIIHCNATTESTASPKVATLVDIPSCNEKDEQINECLLKVFAHMIPRSKNGIPEINIPPMDPLVINKTSYIFSHPLVQGKVAVRNIKIHGLSKATTKSLDYKRQGDQVTVMVKANIPDLFVEGLYKAKIQINTFNITSKGQFNVTFENIDVNVNSTSDLVERDDHRYLNLKTFDFDPTVGNMKFYADGLLPEPLLNEAIVGFLNQNWRSVYKFLIPETRAAWEPEIVKLSRQYFSHVIVDAVIKEN